MSDEAERPSPFVAAQLGRLRATAPLGPCLDLACGRGRHARLLARAGLRVVALDRDAAALREVASRARRESLAISPLRADAESPHGLCLRDARFGAVVVTRFLFRPLAQRIEALLAPGGVLVYETFTIRQRELGHGPRNAAFLLEEGELPRLFPGLAIEAHREGLAGEPTASWLAGVAARKPG
ncbi:MAG: class I SAM-dependent methyltransferase [Proteobacteria bacterium]|nr:MAG: class I SAM-dependent methyltransferase [Pseudomonadota bacterium]